MTFAGPIFCLVAGPVVSWHRALTGARYDCTCLGVCKAASGLAPRWRCVLDSGLEAERISPAEALDALGPWRMWGELARARRAA